MYFCPIDNIMHLERIKIRNFKNITSSLIEFSPRINCITGNNGEGKTNLLDAVWYLSMTKSFFQTNDRFTFTHGENTCTIAGNYVMEDNTVEQIGVSLEKGGEKKIRRGKKYYTKLSQHIGLIPVVMVSPSDSSLINDSGEERRRFLNAFISQIDKNYRSHLHAYNILIQNRNRLLKDQNCDQGLLEIVSMQMENHANYVHDKRKELSDSLLPVASRYYSILSGGKENINFKYISDLNDSSLMELFAEDAAREKVYGYTLSGIQKDDVLFEMDGYQIKKCASQGQQKSFLVALKLAQFTIMQQNYGYAPILLLDDVFDKLDMDRVQSLLEVVASEGFGQIFISDCNKVRLDALVESLDTQCNMYDVKAGAFERII